VKNIRQPQAAPQTNWQCLATATRGEVVGITHLAPFVTATTSTAALLCSMASLMITIIIITYLYSAFRSGYTTAHVSSASPIKVVMLSMPQATWSITFYLHDAVYL